MDDKENFITVTHSGHSEDEIPHDDENEECWDETAEIYDSDTEDENNVSAPRYDDFMYQPIGFEDTVSQADVHEPEKSPKQKKSSVEKAVVILLAILVIITAILAVYGIVSDMYRGPEEVSSVKKSESGNVVLYRSKKPASEDNGSSYIGKDGKYTTEGIAATVRPSIVEIYAYSDIQHQSLQGTGSGVIISDDGYIVTNAHVLMSKGYHIIKTSDDKAYEAKVIGRDVKTDIAIIKISASNLKPAVFGDSDEVAVGEQVMAIGNPAGLSGSVTDGIVSAVNRKIKSDSTGFEMNCIQTNADISPGNSGGALVNMYGQVIGITSSKYVSSYYEGLGFAITINEAAPIIDELISQGFVSGRFRIGIQLIDMSSDIKIMTIEEELGFELPEDFSGIYIAEISEDCDIANTELKVGDFITEINGKTIKTYNDLYTTISGLYGAGDTVPATCAHLMKNGNIEYYNIEFKLMEDTSGNY